MKIAVVGNSYVGLEAGTCFDETGNQVCCVDIDKNKVARLNVGKIPIYEPSLDVLFDRDGAEGRLKFTTNICESITTKIILYPSKL